MAKSTATQESVNQWIAALRSGEYKQVSAHLRASQEGKSGYCCLGVYGLLNGGKESEGDYGLNFEHDNYTYADSFIPDDLMVFEAQSFFSSLNDVSNLSFEEIAMVAKALPMEAFQDDEWWIRTNFRRSIGGLLDVVRMLKNERTTDLDI